MTVVCVHRWLQPHRVFFVLAMVFGMAYLVLTPPFRAPDEPGHFMRVLAYAHGARWGEYEERRSYREFFDAANQARPSVAGRKVTLYDWETLMPILAAGQTQEARNARIPLRNNGPTVSLYSPLAYLPAIAMTMLLDAGGFSPVVIFYSMRFSLLLASSLLLAWAVKRIPYVPWAIAAALLWPVATWGRGVVTADSMTVAYALAFVALALGGKRNLWLLTLTALAVSLSKIIFVIMLLLLATSRTCRLPHLLIGAVATATALLWNIQAGKILQAAIERGTALVSNPAEQVAALKDNPLHFVEAFGATIAPLHFWLVELGKSAVGIIGELDIHLPVGVCVLVGAGTVALLFLRHGEAVVVAGWTRLLAITIVGGCFVGTMLALYIQWNTVGASVIQGFQGRYLLPVLPLLLIALTPSRGIQVPVWVPGALAILLGMVGNISGIVVLVQTSYGR